MKHSSGFWVLWSLFNSCGDRDSLRKQSLGVGREDHLVIGGGVLSCLGLDSNSGSKLCF